jgi:hypothetical protein
VNGKLKWTVGNSTTNYATYVSSSVTWASDKVGEWRNIAFTMSAMNPQAALIVNDNGETLTTISTTSTMSLKTGLQVCACMGILSDLEHRLLWNTPSLQRLV